MRDNPILPSGSSGDDQVPARKCVVGDNDGDGKDDGDVGYVGGNPILLSRELWI